MATEKLHVSKIPNEVIDRACDRIAQYTVGLSRVIRKDNKEDLRLIGTGTLVIVDTLHCILTADHVVAEIRNSDQLSLLTSFTGALRRHVFEYLHLGIHRIARGKDDAVGPDVGLIVLPQNRIGALKGEKIFFNIDKRRERFAETVLEKGRGFWFTPGVIGESEQTLGPTRGFSSIKGYQGLCGTAANPVESEMAGYDYIEMHVDYSIPNPELPNSFGGCSGAGVWQVPMRKNAEGQLEEEDYLLSGIVFYQTAIEGGVRRIRCHGRRTIYRKVPEYMDTSRGPNRRWNEDEPGGRVKS